MADINVTPLVDVMLVLLIIFMVTAPLLTAGVPVNVQTPPSSQRPEVMCSSQVPSGRRVTLPPQVFDADAVSA